MSSKQVYALLQHISFMLLQDISSILLQQYMFHIMPDLFILNDNEEVFVNTFFSHASSQKKCQDRLLPFAM